MLEYHKTTEAEKYIISEWKYEGKYALYTLQKKDPAFLDCPKKLI